MFRSKIHWWADAIKLQGGAKKTTRRGPNGRLVSHLKNREQPFPGDRQAKRAHRKSGGGGNGESKKVIEKSVISVFVGTRRDRLNFKITAD